MEGVEIVILYIIVRNKMIPAHLRVRIRNLRNGNHVKYNTKVSDSGSMKVPTSHTYISKITRFRETTVTGDSRVE